MLESRGWATVQIPVTNPVVIKTTKTQPGTSPRSDLAAAEKVIYILLILVSLLNLRTIALVCKYFMSPNLSFLVPNAKLISIEFR
jgi:hypothetical protein